MTGMGRDWQVARSIEDVLDEYDPYYDGSHLGPRVSTAADRLTLTWAGCAECGKTVRVHVTETEPVLCGGCYEPAF